MAITGVDRGTGGNNASEASTAMSPTSTIAAGSAGILLIAADNANGTSSNFPNPVTDSVGNSWVLRLNALAAQIAGNQMENAIYVCDSLATQLTSSNNVTITYSAANVTAKAFAFVEATPATAGNICLYRGGQSQGVQAGATTGTIVSAWQVLTGEIVIGMAAVEGNPTFTGDADTANGSWSTAQTTGFGVGAAAMSICSQWKVPNAIANQTYNPTWGTSGDCRVSIIQLTEVPPKTRTCNVATASEAISTIIFNKAIASGSMAVLIWTGDDAGASGTTANLQTPTLTDSKGNTWTLRQDAAYAVSNIVNSGAELGIYTASITTPLVINDTVTITYTGANVVAKSWRVFEFSDATGYANSGIGSGSTTASPTITTGSITYPDYVIGACASEGDSTWVADADTSNGSWSSGAITSSGAGGTSSACGIAQYKKVTGSGTQTYNPTLTSADNIIGWVELTVPAPATGNTGAFFQFF